MVFFSLMELGVESKITCFSTQTPCEVNGSQCRHLGTVLIEIFKGTCGFYDLTTIFLPLEISFTA